MTSQRLAFPLPPTAPLFASRTVPKQQLGLASSNEAPFLSATSSRDAMAQQDRVITNDQAWADSLTAFQKAAAFGRRDSDSSSTSASTDSNGFSSNLSSAPTSRSGSGGEDLLDCLGRGAVDLLEQLEQVRKDSPPRRARRVPLFEDLVEASDPNWSPPAGSPIAGPSTYQRTRRPQDFAGARSLASSTSVATLRSTTTLRKATSFTRTDVCELDIESLLNAYEECEEELQAMSMAERTPRQPSTKTIYDPSLAPSRAKSISGSSARFVNRELVFPSPATSSATVDRSIPALPRHPSEVSSPPYSDFFPRHRVSPFPTKKKSTVSLRSQAQTPPLPASPPPPLPSLAVSIPSAPRHLASPISQISPERRQSSVYSSDSSDSPSPRSSVRCSYQSSASSSATGSFRWSTASGSTANTIAEESDWDGSRRDSVAASSCRSVGSSGAPRRASLGGSLRSPSLRSTKSSKALRPMNELLDWTSFAEELLDEQAGDADEEGMSEGDRRRRATSLRGDRPSAKSLRRAQSIKGSLATPSSSAAAETIPPLPTLAKKHSLLSLRHIRSAASLANKPPPPPVPTRHPSRLQGSAARQ